jgi:cyclic pyranopterin phosphate synthase
MITHLDNNNNPTIVDVSKKNITQRIAIAEGIVKFTPKVFKEIEKMKTKKGEIKNIAIIAGIMGAKKTSDLIPLCHNVGIDNIKIKIKTNKITNSLIITSKVKSSGKTGVEMEALTAVSTSCLTIYDMCKSLDKGIIIKEIKLISKTGGKSDYIKKSKL